MKVIRKVAIVLTVFVLGTVIGLGGLLGAQTARYVVRGFEFTKAAQWALDDVIELKDTTGFVDMFVGMGFDPNTQLVKMKTEYPMANANITWDLLWKKP